MTRDEILRTVDHTLLDPCATWDEIRQICDDALTYGTASVCIPAAYGFSQWKNSKTSANECGFTSAL